MNTKQRILQTARAKISRAKICLPQWKAAEIAALQDAKRSPEPSKPREASWSAAISAAFHWMKLDAGAFLCRTVLAFVLFAFSEAKAQTPPAETTWVLTMKEAIEMALTNNLDIRISDVTPTLDQFALNTLNAVYEPALNLSAAGNYNASFGGIDPTTSIPYPASMTTVGSYSAGVSGLLPSGLTYNLTGPFYRESVDGSSPLYGSSPGITLNQPILRNLWIDNNRLQISLARKTLQSDRLAACLQIITVINNVKAAYYNLVYARDNVKVRADALKLARELAAENEKKVDLGSLAPLDARQAESQAATSAADLLSAQQSQEMQENVLKTLINDNYSQWARTTPVPSEVLLAVPEAVDLQECLRNGVSRRPDFLAGKVDIERQHVTIKYNRNQLFPEIDLFGGYGQNSTGVTVDNNLSQLREGTYPFYSYGISMTIPLGNTAARNNYKSAKENLKLSLLKLKKLEQTIVVAIDNDVKQVRSTLLRVKADREAAVYAEEALKAEQTKLEAGKSTSFVVLQLQSNLTAARSTEIRALADYNIALEQLAFDDGTTLDRNGIQIHAW